jgi:hypothetical protein
MNLRSSTNHCIFIWVDKWFYVCGRYYSLDAYYRRQMEKEMKKGFKQVKAKERTVFNDEEQRRYDFEHATLLV